LFTYGAIKNINDFFSDSKILNLKEQEIYKFLKYKLSMKNELRKINGIYFVES